MILCEKSVLDVIPNEVRNPCICIFLKKNSLDALRSPSELTVAPLPQNDQFDILHTDLFDVTTMFNHL